MSDAVIGFVGVLVGVVSTIAMGVWNDWRSRRKNAEYLAIRVVSMLDRYLDGAVAVVGDDGLRDGQTDADGYHQIQVTPPAFDAQALEDADWKSLPSQLMYEILSFPNLIEAANHRIDAAFEYAASPPDFSEGFEERRYQYAALGLAASRVASNLRTAYVIPARETSDWDPIEYLLSSKAKLDTLRAARSEHNARLLSGLPDVLT